MPLQIQTLEQLESSLSEPTPGAVQAMRQIEGDLMLLGVAGKMGPSLARMARRSSEEAGIKRRIIGVARFTSGSVQGSLERDGIETIRCDLLDEEAWGGLPEVPNLLYLAGMKFGSTGQESLTWAMNTYLPSLACRRFPRSRVVAFSTGNVYGLVPHNGSGSKEADAPSPVGEYAMSCLGRERMFEHFSRLNGTPVALIRLNYACDLRYGVLVDLAQKVKEGRAIDLGMGWFNTIWQGDANAIALQALVRASSPPFILNVTGPERLRVKDVSVRLGSLLGREPVFSGTEEPQALLSDPQLAVNLFGKPRIGGGELLELVADWVSHGRPTLNKPTHFDSRDGQF